MERLWKALLNSLRAWRRLISGEAAFRQEVALLVAAIPVAWFVARDWETYTGLILSILFLITVEVLNTGIEFACNAVTREFNKDIQHAKDCGSLAVLLALVIVLIIWGMALWERIAG
ncbi:MAG: diacylglycerol kinase [Notoacmeibacter sp.]|nr:diacylglycerol kinase [Notoacmeibacter sp.]